MQDPGPLCRGGDGGPPQAGGGRPLGLPVAGSPQGPREPRGGSAAFQPRDQETSHNLSGPLLSCLQNGAENANPLGGWYRPRVRR